MAMLSGLQKAVKNEILDAKILLSDITAAEIGSRMFDGMTHEEQADFMTYLLLSPNEKAEINRRHLEQITDEAKIETTKLLKYISKHHPTEYATMMQTAPKEADWLDWQNFAYGQYIRILEKR